MYDLQQLTKILTKDGKPGILYIKGPHCPVCKQTTPVVEKLAIEGYKKVNVYVADISDRDDMQYATHYNVSSIPWMFIFNGRSPAPDTQLSGSQINWVNIQNKLKNYGVTI